MKPEHWIAIFAVAVPSLLTPMMTYYWGCRMERFRARLKAETEMPKPDVIAPNPQPPKSSQKFSWFAWGILAGLIAYLAWLLVRTLLWTWGDPETDRMMLALILVNFFAVVFIAVRWMFLDGILKWETTPKA